MRVILLALVVCLLAAADDYEVEREVVVHLVDGRELTGIYQKESGELAIRSAGGKVASIRVRERDIAQTEPSPAATAVLEKRRAAVREAEKRQEQEALEQRIRERKEASERLQNETAELERQASIQRATQDVAAMYAEKGYRFNPLKMTSEEMHEAYRRGEADKVEAARVEGLQRLRQQRIAEEAERQRKNEQQAKLRQEAEEQRLVARREQEARDVKEHAADQALRDKHRRTEEIKQDVGLAISNLMLVVLGVIAFLFLILPICIANYRRHPHIVPIVIVLLGSAAIGGVTTATINAVIVIAPSIFSIAWVGCLAWSCWPLLPRPGVRPPLPSDSEQEAEPRG